MERTRRLAILLVAALLIGMLAFGSASASGTEDVNAQTPSEGVALKEDIVIGMQFKHTTVDPMEASNTRHNYMWRMVFDTASLQQRDQGNRASAGDRVVHRGQRQVLCL